MPNLRHLAEKKIILHALMPSQSANIECLRAKNIKKINIVKKSEKKLKVCCWSNFFNLNMLHQNNKVRRPYVTNINFIKQHLNTKIAKTPKNENFQRFIKKSG